MNIPQREKPRANILLKAQTEHDGTYPLFTIMDVGAGKSALLSGRSFFRWNMESDNESGVLNPLELFYKNIIESVSSYNKDSFLHLNLPKSNFYIGDKINIEAYVFDKNYSPARSDKVEGTVSDADNNSEKLSFYQMPGDISAYTSSFTPKHTGVYCVCVTSTGFDKTISSAKTYIAVSMPSDEFKRVTADFGVLQKMAHSSGGKFYTFPEFSSMINKIKPDKIKYEMTITKQITEYPYILLIIIFAISLEWYIRTKSGLL